MKKFLLIAAVLFASVSCYNDSKLWESVNSLEERLLSMEAIVKAYEDNLFIESMKQVNGGYVIEFSDGSKTTFLGGYDNQDGELFISYITVNENGVDFFLTDGTYFTILFSNALSIEFDSDDMVVMYPNSTRDIRYTVTSVLPDVQVEVLTSGDVLAKVIPDETGEATGVIRVKVSGDFTDDYCKLVVLVSNGEKVIMRTLTFEEETIEIVDEAKVTVNADGGEIELLYLSNIECEVVIPEDAKSWISVVPDTKAIEQKSIKLLLKQNFGASRESVVSLQNKEASMKLDYTILQEPDIDYQLQVEREALIAIYKALDGDNWANNEFWCSDKPIYEWAGVTTNEEGFVVELSFHYGVKGELPEQIRELTKLRKIESACNNMTGNPFDHIVHNENLEYIGFVDCPISGILPNTINKLSHLKSLGITRTDMTGEIPSSLFDCTSLTYLALSEGDVKDYNHGLGGFSGEISDKIMNLSNLTHLSLDQNPKLTGTILDKISKLDKLYNVNIEGCNFYGSLPVEFSQILDNIKDVIDNRDNYSDDWRLGIGFNDFTGDIPKCIVQHPIWPIIWGEIIGCNSFNVDVSMIPAPNFDIFDMKGTRQSSDNYKDYNITMLYQWNWGINIHQDVTTWHDQLAGYGLNIIGLPLGMQTYENTLKYIEDSQIKWNVCPLGVIHPWGRPHMNLINNRLCYPTHNSVSLLMVDRNGKVVYWNQMNNDGFTIRDIEEILYQKCEYVNYYTSTDYSQDGKVKSLQTASKGEGVNIVLMGDAYSDRQIADGTYDRDMMYLYNNLFAEEPYKSLKDYFNVQYVNVVSNNEGYELYTDTALDGFFGCGTHVGGSDNACFEYALNAISENDMDEALIIVAMNSDNYAGTCYMYYPESATGTYGSGPSVAYFSKGSDQETFAQLLHHEACGHGFAKLADEYAYEDYGAVPSDYVSQIQTQQNEWGWWKNVDFTNDPSQVRWSYFLEDERYQYDGLGCFEGGLTYWSGVWRPTENSIMRYNTGGFNAPSREAIWYRIHKLAYGDSWEYDYEDFVEYDAINRASSASAPQKSRGNYVERTFEPTAPPVIVNKSWREVK